MKKISILMASAALIALSAPAFSADKVTSETQSKVTRDSDGNYTEKDSSSKTDSGAKTSAETNFKADIDADGSGTKTLETKKTRKTGLLSKDSVKTKDKQKIHSDGTVESSHKKVVNGTTTEDTSTTTGH